MSEPSTLAIVADIASIGSLGITVYVAFQLREVKRSVVLSARVPAVFRDLQRHCDSLRENLKAWPSLEREANGVLEQIDGILINILPKLGGPEKKKVSAPQSLIRKRTAFWNGWSRKSDKTRHDKLWEIHDALLGAVEALQQLDKDHKKRL